MIAPAEILLEEYARDLAYLDAMGVDLSGPTPRFVERSYEETLWCRTSGLAGAELEAATAWFRQAWREIKALAAKAEREGRDLWHDVVVEFKGRRGRAIDEGRDPNGVIDEYTNHTEE